MQYKLKLFVKRRIENKLEADAAETDIEVLDWAVLSLCISTCSKLLLLLLEFFLKVLLFDFPIEIESSLFLTRYCLTSVD